ncbi:MAG TPA: DUF885 family protein, partial [Candidatus Eremiobacteraceae bacterium]|nr:DUF885 family protein [Candidatus Eremiobacteraceae bacterium]
MRGSAQPPSADDSYTSLAQAYFHTFFAQNPSAASAAGTHEYDGKLDDLSAQHFASQLALDKDYLAKLNAIAPASLSPEVRIDRQMLIWAIKDDLLTNGTEANWRHNPDVYTQTASGAIYLTMAYQYAPLPDRLRYAIARERQIPRLLLQGRKNITSVDAATAEVSYQDAAGSADFFRSDVPQAFAAVKDATLQREFKAASAGAIQAFGQYAQWIKRGLLAHPSGTFAIGKEAYQERLLYIDGITMPVEQYLALGERTLRATQDQFAAVAHRIDPHHTPHEVYTALSHKHPAGKAVPAAAQRDVTNLRAFINTHHIITLPPDSDLKV